MLNFVSGVSAHPYMMDNLMSQGENFASPLICPSEEKQGCLESRGSLLCPLALAWPGTVLNLVLDLHLFSGQGSSLVHVLEAGLVNTHLYV